MPAGFTVTDRETAPWALTVARAGATASQLPPELVDASALKGTGRLPGLATVSGLVSAAEERTNEKASPAGSTVNFPSMASSTRKLTTRVGTETAAAGTLKVTTPV